MKKGRSGMSSRRTPQRMPWLSVRFTSAPPPPPQHADLARWPAICVLRSARPVLDGCVRRADISAFGLASGQRERCRKDLAVGSGGLANIEFSAQMVGLSPLTLSNVCLNFSCNAGTDFLLVNGSVIVGPQVAPVPEPSTLSLLGVWLAAWGMYGAALSVVSAG